MVVRYAMWDADDAQYNAVQRVLDVDSNLNIIMCFYHVVAKVYEKTKGLQPALYAGVAKGLNGLHYATTEAQFIITQERVLDDWSLHPGLASFKAYFTSVWLSRRFTPFLPMADISHTTRVCDDEQSCRELQRCYQARLHTALSDVNGRVTA
ncbi:hypothetical protein L916_17635 [Phytophthora nicotianae]|uniref:MULE transposase domain-containing protein n=1 Tax=Phytophthora nicotianae TaxID=4792 RepID=W2I6R8_PHYNI|nr:hypothetical protein L916_17635 [Phytophthora nicotianae]